MKARIYGKWPGSDDYDSIVLTGDSFEDLKKRAEEAVASRRWRDCWSEGPEADDE